MKGMVIVESGAKGKKIKQYLGRGFIVDSCKGHVQDLPGYSAKDKKQARKAMWASKPDSLPDPPWDWTDTNAERTVRGLLKKAEKHSVDTVFIATDPDREGEFIAWRLAEIFSGYKTMRISFNEITKKAVISAIESPREIDLGLVDAAKVRRFMDRLVGFRSSKFSRSWNLTSMGRVQTPTLGFIVEREMERRAFVPQPYFSVNASICEIPFKVRFHEKNDPEAWFDGEGGVHHPERTNDRDLATSAVSSLSKSKTLEISEVKMGKRSSTPKPPFSTPSLLRTAGSHPKIGWSTKRIMQVANDLYQAGFITYIRTDSTRTNPESRKEIRDHIASKWGPEFLREDPGIVGKERQSGQAGIQDAHEAIRPTDPKNVDPEGLDKRQKILYNLIWSRFAASQMSNSRYETMSIKGAVEGFQKVWVGSTSWRVHDGWEAAYIGLRKDPNLTPPEIPTDIGAKLKLDGGKENPKLIEDETKPPSRFRQHSLVEKMQNEGIGRPSTYASTIEKLLARKYVFEDSKALVPSENGVLLWEQVAPMYGNGEENRGVFDAEFTAVMEASLDSIENGNEAAPKIWDRFVEQFSNAHNSALEIRRSKPTPKQLNYMKQLLHTLEEGEIAEILGGLEPDEISGERAKEVIDELTSRNIATGPSEKQISFIYKLIESLEMSDKEASEIIGIGSFDELTGGRDGSASSLISILKEMQSEKPRPPTEKQIKYLRDLLKKSKVEENEVCLRFECSTIEELTFQQVSLLIGDYRRLSRGNN